MESKERASGGLRAIAKWSVSTVAAVAVVAAGVWTTRCPCEGTPGAYLFGAGHDDPVSDWSFANDVPLCQIQISVGIRPHAVNLNCMASPDGELFLSCSRGEAKYWCPRVGSDEKGRLRLDGVVYPVVLNRVTDEATLDKAWSARVAKLQRPEVVAVQPGGATTPPDAERPGHWWSFRVESRGE